MTGLRLDPRNARRHSDRNKRQIRKSLETVGAGRSILADADGIIRAGNGVYSEWGDKPVKIVETDGSELVVVQRTDLRGQDAIRAAALDNLVADSSAFDYDAAILAEIARDDDVIRAIANEDAKLRELLRKENGTAEKVDAGELIDKAAQLQEKWQVRRGDVWQIGKHRLMCGDSTSKEDVERLMDGKRAKLLWADPPYHVGKDFGEYDEGNIWDAEFQNAWLDCAFGALDTDAQRYICFAQARSRDAMLCYKPKRLLVWCKPFALMRANEWDWAYEFTAWCYDTEKPTYFDKPRGTASFDWQNIPSVIHGQEGKYHITQKPIALPTGHISASSRQGEIVLDTFLGSGTTLVACEQTGRIGYGMEIEPRYVSVALERLTNLGLQPQRLSDG